MSEMWEGFRSRAKGVMIVNVAGVQVGRIQAREVSYRK